MTVPLWSWCLGLARKDLGDGDEGAEISVLGVRVEGRRWEAVLVRSVGLWGRQRGEVGTLLVRLLLMCVEVGGCGS